jgi:L-threonine-O-3-phosphate decarboxylase
VTAGAAGRPAHGGDRRALALRAGCLPTDLLDFSANINPLGMPPAARTALVECIEALGDYPDPDCTALRAAIGTALDLPPARVLPGNGAEQLIWWLPRLLGARRVVMTAPCYLDYRRASKVWGLEVVSLSLTARDDFLVDLTALAAMAGDGDLVWLGHPNNPTGRLLDMDAVAATVAARPGVWWALDEAFIDFAEAAASGVHLGLENLIVVRSMTKFFALAGLRLGYAVLAPTLAAAGRRLLPDWSVSTPAQAVGVAVLTDASLPDYSERTRRLIRAQRQTLTAGLRDLGAKVVDGAANYLLWRLPETAPTGVEVADALLRRRHIAVRTCDDYVGLDGRWLRVAVRTADENASLLEALAAVLR